MDNVRLYVQNGEIWISLPWNLPSATTASGIHTVSAGRTEFSLSGHLRDLMTEAFRAAYVGQAPVTINPNNSNL